MHTQPNLFKPLGSGAVSITTDKVHLRAHFGDLGLELPDVGRPVLDAREHVREETVEERDVLGNQFWNHSLTYTLNENLTRGGGGVTKEEEDL